METACEALKKKTLHCDLFSRAHFLPESYEMNMTVFKLPEMKGKNGCTEQVWLSQME